MVIFVLGPWLLSCLRGAGECRSTCRYIRLKLLPAGRMLLEYLSRETSTGSCIFPYGLSVINSCYFEENEDARWSDVVFP